MSDSPERPVWVSMELHEKVGQTLDPENIDREREEAERLAPSPGALPPWSNL